MRTGRAMIACRPNNRLVLTEELHYFEVTQSNDKKSIPLAANATQLVVLCQLFG